MKRHLCLFLLSSLLILPGCSTNPSPWMIKVACVGDSVTYGYGLTTKDSYPAQLGDLLGAGYLVENFGVNGAAVADYAMTPACRASLEFEPDILIIQLGSNDTTSSTWIDADTFMQRYRALLATYAATDARIILCTPPSAYTAGSVYQFGLQPEPLKTVCQCVAELAAEFDLELVDLQTLTASHREWFSDDAVHPNESGAAAIAQAVKQAICG